MREHRHHKQQFAALVLTAAVALTGCGGEDGGSADGKKDGGKNGKGDAAAKADPSGPSGKSKGAIPAKGVVVKAWCAVPANKPADVVVEAWDPGSWKKVATTTFTLPTTTVMTEEDNASTPLAELCKGDVVTPEDTGTGTGTGTEDEGPKALAEPRVRQLFNDDFTKLAVVLKDTETEGTRAAVVTPGNAKPTMVNKSGGSDFADAPTEQHPVFAPGGSDQVWYMTKAENEDKPTFFTAPAERRGKGDELSAQRPGFTLAGSPAGPASALTASVLRLSPDSRKAAGFHEMQGMNVVDVPRRTTVQRDDDAPLHPLGSCMPLGWTDSTTVLCGEREMTEDDPARKNNFWTVDSTRLKKDEEPPSAAIGKPILPKTSRKNTLRALSPDGKQMILTSRQGTVTEHFTARTAPGAAPKKITAKGADQALRAGQVLEWR
ncbi:hypothetical protein [Streptomyces sp. NPDC048172]|uniref:hypothetical protein n=1 Tax=Streptomyces sp. NPDC048172 TaxID=3365505 RepID=UPI0037249268